MRTHFSNKEKIKINTLTTYRSIVSIFIAVLLLNASVFKEIHAFFLHDHHHQPEIEHNDICNHSTHMHEIEHGDLECSICDFNFSPSEKLTSVHPHLVVIPTTEMQYFYKENIAFRTVEPYPMLRAPPTLI